MTKFGYKLGCSLKLQVHLIFFYSDVNIEKSTIGLHFIFISYMLAKISED